MKNLHCLFSGKENVRPVFASVNDPQMNKDRRVRFNSSKGAWIEILKEIEGLALDTRESNERNELINEDKFNVSLMLKQDVFSSLYFVLIR